MSFKNVGDTVSLGHGGQLQAVYECEKCKYRTTHGDMEHCPMCYHKEEYEAGVL